MSDNVEYAVQVRWPNHPDGYMFVTTGDSFHRIPETYSTRDEAETAASIWAEGATRVMRRTVSEWEVDE